MGDSGLDLALGDLYLLLHQSLSWLKSVRGVFRRENMGSEVRSSDLERGSSFNVGLSPYLRPLSLLLLPHLVLFMPSRKSVP